MSSFLSSKLKFLVRSMAGPLLWSAVYLENYLYFNFNHLKLLSLNRLKLYNLYIIDIRAQVGKVDRSEVDLS